jgi:hypothetical protein
MKATKKSTKDTGYTDYHNRSLKRKSVTNNYTRKTDINLRRKVIDEGDTADEGSRTLVTSLGSSVVVAQEKKNYSG